MKDIFKTFTVSKEVYNDLIAHPHDGIKFLGKSRIRVKEIWKDAIGFNGFYMVSTLGRVKRLARMRPGKRSYFLKEVIMKLTPLSKEIPYLVVALQYNKHKKRFRVNRLIAQTFHSNPENKPFVHHNDNRKQKNMAFNLSWATVSENTQHAYDTGRIKKKFGEEAPSAKLSNFDVKKIRQASRRGVSQKDLARQFNCTVSNIYMIRTNRSRLSE